MLWLFAVTSFASACLLFLLQPMFAKMVLPKLGGSPSVWNTCMVFYQTLLLAGYAYAHYATRWLGVRRQALVHLAVLGLPGFVLPIHVSAAWTPETSGNPSAWLLAVMATSVGLPFLAISASAPMLQAWFADTGHPAATEPYVLYAASNLGSLLALLSYPTLLEPFLPLAGHSLVWSAGYGLLSVLIVGCAAGLWRSAGRSADVARESSPVQDAVAQQGKRRRRDTHLRVSESAADSRTSDASMLIVRLKWLALSFAPSSLLLGVTAYISAEVVAVPLMWVVPLALYLLTFVLTFARNARVPNPWLVRCQVPLMLVVVVLYYSDFMSALRGLWIPLHLAAFFVTAMVCHGELARLRPEPRRLTEFYLWISVGGMLGGLFNAILAPWLFNGIVEYPLVMAVACMLRPSRNTAAETRRSLALDVAIPLSLLLIAGGVLLGMELAGRLASQAFTLVVLVLAGVVVFLSRTRPLRFGLGIGAILLVGGLDLAHGTATLHAERNFFGVLRVRYLANYHALMLQHGSTNHGMQFVDRERRHEPLTYYHRTGPLGQVFQALGEKGRIKEVGITGLGTGAIASYGQPGQHFTFFEIDPAVEQIARNPDYFTYLSQSKAKVDVVIGDARLTLANARDGRFDLLILDAFTSDALPLHLINLEAVQLYLDKLAPHGVLAFNISNRYFNLAPVFGNISHELGLACYGRSDRPNDPSQQIVGKSSSIWLVMARAPEDLGELSRHPAWRRIAPDPRVRTWTDDFCDVLSVLCWW